MLVAFVSYLFTWQIDQSKLDISFFELFKDATISVENWAGKLGAMMAHKFMFDWFGIASFSLVFLLGRRRTAAGSPSCAGWKATARSTSRT
jgi:S-DNA-T family DNA segregation ATPase FtsK/SpoIIIE